MARVTAIALRDRARAAVFSAGGRGFVRFLDSGDALLVTDAIRRCEEDAARMRLIRALEDAGFACDVRDGLLALTPVDDVLSALACEAEGPIDWAGPLHPAQALARRWLAVGTLPMTSDGRRLAIEALRLTWQPQSKVLAGLERLRAQAAVMQRHGDKSGFWIAGTVLENWCMNVRGGNEDEA